ncbi:Aste57867_201 [Aphanomyces stellatus]|uniref:Aste57867_201 protein n=1 Tax=Aphanomyces stellatus TaxID=120398 RepID=A0A485K204_9STRA|nr:hypothetical protein As57867_000201 [Aphanomyces stellatus]VFT77427.1 Aste57867_201 [Aphanomyces stellatus]
MAVTTYFGHTAASASTPRRFAPMTPTSASNVVIHEDEVPEEDDEPRRNSMSMEDPTVQKSLFEMFNKRGYNLISPSHSTVNCSFTSTASTSSVISFREPVHGQTPIHIAIRRGDVKVVEALLRSDTDLTDMRDDHGNTPLHFAVGTSRRIPLTNAVRMVAMLLHGGANVHAVNNKGRSPIMVHLLTIQKDDASILTMLLDEGANVNTEIDRVTLLHVAASNNLPIVASTLVSHGAHLHTTNELGLYLHQYATTSMLVSILAHIKVARPYVTVDMHHQCSDCRRVVKPARVNVFFRWLFRTKSEATNCFHCGWIYCHHCTAMGPWKDALPSTFHRDENDDINAGFRRNKAPSKQMFKNIRCCRICTQILKERLAKPRPTQPHFR